MGLTREQFKNNFSIFSYFFIAVLIFGFLNFTKETIELRILLFLFISCGIAYFLYNQKKEKEKEQELLDQGDQKLFNDVNANYFKNDQFYFDFFRKNYFLKDLNVYTWREVIKHCDNYIKIVKLMDGEIEHKPQLLDMAKMEKNHILNLFSSFIVGVKPGTSNLNSSRIASHVLTN